MNINPVFSLPSGEVIDPYLRVRVNASGQAVKCGAGQRSIGHSLQYTLATPQTEGVGRDVVDIHGSGAGKHYAISEDAIALGGEFESAASGKIKALAGGTAAGQVVETYGGGSGASRQYRVVYYID